MEHTDNTNQNLDDLYMGNDLIEEIDDFGFDLPDWDEVTQLVYAPKGEYTLTIVDVKPKQPAEGVRPSFDLILEIESNSTETKYFTVKETVNVPTNVGKLLKRSDGTSYPYSQKQRDFDLSNVKSLCIAFGIKWSSGRLSYNDFLGRSAEALIDFWPANDKYPARNKVSTFIQKEG